MYMLEIGLENYKNTSIHFLFVLIAILSLFCSIFVSTASAENSTDLIIQSITWDPLGSKTGDTVKFTVTYKNQGTVSTGQGFYVSLYIDGTYVNYNSVADLAAGTSGTTTFSWNVGRDVSDGTHAITAYVDMTHQGGSDAHITESVESNNELSKNFQVSKLSPDLIIQNIAWDPPSPKTGDTVTFTVTYKNQGTVSAGQGFYVSLYVDGTYVKYDSVTDLASGSSGTTTFTWTVGRDVSDGTHAITAYVDMSRQGGSDAHITESIESNNELSKNFQISKQAPDLIIQDITSDPPGPKTGDTVTFTVTYKNQGSLNAGQGFYVSLYVDGTYVKYNSVADLAAGTSGTTTFTWTVGRDVSDGTHAVTAYVDMTRQGGSDAHITESVESNNELSKNFQISKQSPDLIIQNITWDPPGPKTGDTVTFTVTYKNQGTLNAGQGFYVSLYVDGTYVKYDSVTDLASGSSGTTTFTWTVGRDVSDGTHAVTAYVDMSRQGGSDAHITESIESNNELSKNFQISKQAPDLIIQDITSDPPGPKTGDTVTFTVTYKNQGSLNAGQGFYVSLYVDGTYVKYDSVTDLAAGTSATTTFTWTVGRDVSDGTHAVTAYVDMTRQGGSDAHITENVESNNELSKNFQISKQSPDLIIQNITWDPPGPKTGDTVTFTVTYKNQGTFSVDRSFYVSLYIDGTYIKYNSVADLSSNASAATTFSWNVGRDVSEGDHTVSAYVDMTQKGGSNAQITESDESNNEKEIKFSILKIFTYSNLTINVKDSRNNINLIGANVNIGNESVGQTDTDGKITKKVIEGMNYLIEVEKSDYYPKTQIITLGHDEKEKEMTISLDYAKIPITISVEGDRQKISGAIVYLDGNQVGITDIDGKVIADVTKNKDSELKVIKEGFYEENAMIHIESYEKTYSIKLRQEDKTVPNIVISNIEKIGDDDDVLEVDESVRITYSVMDNSGISKIICKLDGKDIDSYSTGGTYTTTTQPLTIGNHIIQFEALDADVNPHKSLKDVPISVSKKGPSVVFQSTKNIVNIRENAIFTLGALNPIGNPNMSVQLVLKTPTGVSVLGSSFAEAGAGMYTTTYEIEPGDDMKYITLDLAGNELGMHNVKAEVHYSIPGENTVTLNKELQFEVRNPVNPEGNNNPIENIKKSVPGFSTIITLVGLSFVVFIIKKKIRYSKR